MKLYLDRYCAFMLKNGFNIFDENKNICYSCRAEGARSYRITDHAGREVALITPRFLSLAPKFMATVADKEYIILLKSAHLIVKDTDYKSEGDLTHTDYQIVKESRVLANVRRIQTDIIPKSSTQDMYRQLAAKYKLNVSLENAIEIDVNEEQSDLILTFVVACEIGIKNRNPY